MQELLIDELKDLYSAEKQIIRALPKLAKATSSPDLQEALLGHLEETKGQVARLEKIGEIVGKTDGEDLRRDEGCTRRRIRSP
jgi:ferritin-like metal-binding protein YciE